MMKFRERKPWIVLIAVLLLFAACKGESPTAPPPGGGTPPSGGTPPPSGVNLVLTTTNSSPLVDSTVTVTATVTQNGANVPDGTAVEFVATGGVLNGGGTGTIKTTTNGVATVTLTSGATGLIQVTATVNNVTRATNVNFVARPVIPGPPNTAPTITSVSPTVGRPQGGEVIRITGTNFKTPVRVLFNTGGATAVEGSVQSVTDTQIEVITPPVNLAATQQVIADVIVLTQAGTTTEQRVEASDSFTYRNTILTPVISTVTPNSGPVTGGTRVTIFGDGFQEPVQVLFNTAEARVLNVAFDRINVETPAGRDTNPDGSGTVTGPVTVTVRNINSQTETTMASGFLYKAAMQITTYGPGEGPYTGGTSVDIEGIGFVAPVAVVIGGVAAQPVFVSGTKITAITSPVLPEGCADVSGIVSVTNIVNGDTATAGSFIYRVFEPVIVSVGPANLADPIINPGESVRVTVANPGAGFVRIKLGDRTVFPSSTINNGDGTTTYVLAVPTNLEFETAECPTGGARAVPLDLDVEFTNLTTGCTDTAEQALTVNPVDESCVIPPAELSTTPTSGGACAPATATSATDPATGTATITVTNSAEAGSQSLQVTGVAASNQVNVAVVSISPPSATIAAGASRAFTVTVNPTAAGAYSADITFTTNVGDTTVCVSGTATP